MSSIGDALAGFVQNLVAFVLMFILAVVTFFITVFVVDLGAALAGYSGNDYVVISAAVLVGAAIIAGGVSPISAISGVEEPGRRPPGGE